MTDNVNELADYGLVEFKQDGRAKRSVVWYDEIDIDLPLSRRDADVAPA